jgi:hypothetical protein
MCEDSIAELKGVLEKLLAAVKIDVGRVTKMFQLERTKPTAKGKAKAKATAGGANPSDAK